MNQIMRVLVIACKFEAGGAPRSMMEMVLNLKAHFGIKVTVAVFGDNLLADWCRKNQIDYVVTGHDIFAVAKDRGFKSSCKRIARLPLLLYRNRRAIKIIEKIIDMSQIDIIHTNSNRDNFGGLLAKKYNIPHVWHLREYGKEDYDTRFVLPFSIYFMNRTTTRFIAISNGVRNAWINRGIIADRITRIYNGINTSDIIRKSQFALSKKFIRIVFTGSLFRFKGQQELLEALSKVNKVIRDNIIIDFYYEGVDSDYETEIKEMISKNGLQSNCNFLGAVNGVAKLLKDYDIGITCSKSEAFGRVTVEYMAAGLITIASNTGANPEIIEDGKSGFLYEYGNPDSLSRILEKIYNFDENEKQKIGQAAIERVEQNFTDRINAKNVYNLYLDILRERQKSDVNRCY